MSQLDTFIGRNSCDLMTREVMKKSVHVCPGQKSENKRMSKQNNGSKQRKTERGGSQ